MLNKLIKHQELFIYTLIGGIATLIDWSTFAVSVNYLSLHYQIALVLSLFFAGSFHYTCNKLITFRCKSKKIASQLVLYVGVSIISLCLSMTIMAVLVRVFTVNIVFLRMFTTVVMLLPNYHLHKNITFRKKHLAPGLFPQG